MKSDCQCKQAGKGGYRLPSMKSSSLKVLLRRKYTFFNLTGYEKYITQIVTVPNLKSEF